MKDHNWYTAHRMPEEYVDLSGKSITDLKLHEGDLFIFKPEGIWKLTKHGLRKVKKPFGWLKSQPDKETE